MDPITAVGAVASIVTLAQTALSLSQTLYTLGSGVSSASEDLQDLAEDLKTFSQSLTLLSRLLEDSKSWYSDDIYLLTAKIIKDCAELYEKIDKVLSKLGANGKTTWKLKVKFVYKEGQIRKLLKRLRDMKGTLATILMSLQVDLQLSLLNINSSSRFQRNAKEELRPETVATLESAQEAAQARGAFSKYGHSLDKTYHVKSLENSLQAPQAPRVILPTQSFVTIPENFDSSDPLSTPIARPEKSEPAASSHQVMKRNLETTAKIATRSKSIRSIQSFDSFKSAVAFQDYAENQDLDVTIAVKAVESVLHAFRTALESLGNLVLERLTHDDPARLTATELNDMLVLSSRTIKKRYMEYCKTYSAEYVDCFRVEEKSCLHQISVDIMREIIVTLHILLDEKHDLTPPCFSALLTQTKEYEEKAVDVLSRVASRTRQRTVIPVTAPFVGYTLKRFDSSQSEICETRPQQQHAQHQKTGTLEASLVDKEHKLPAQDEAGQSKVAEPPLPPEVELEGQLSYKRRATCFTAGEPRSRNVGNFRSDLNKPLPPIVDKYRKRSPARKRAPRTLAAQEARAPQRIYASYGAPLHPQLPQELAQGFVQYPPDHPEMQQPPVMAAEYVDHSTEQTVSLGPEQQLCATEIIFTGARRSSRINVLGNQSADAEPPVCEDLTLNIPSSSHLELYMDLDMGVEDSDDDRHPSQSWQKRAALGAKRGRKCSRSTTRRQNVDSDEKLPPIIPAGISNTWEVACGVKDRYYDDSFPIAHSTSTPSINLGPPKRPRTSRVQLVQPSPPSNIKGVSSYTKTPSREPQERSSTLLEAYLPGSKPGPAHYIGRSYSRTSDSSPKTLWWTAYQNLKTTNYMRHTVLDLGLDLDDLRKLPQAQIAMQLSERLKDMPTIINHRADFEEVLELRDNIVRVMKVIDQQMGLGIAVVGWACMWRLIDHYDSSLADASLTSANLDTLHTVFSQLHEITSIIARYAVMENLYTSASLYPSDLALKPEYKAALIKLCAAMLMYFSTAFELRRAEISELCVNGGMNQGVFNQEHKDGLIRQLVWRLGVEMREVVELEAGCRGFRVVIDVLEEADGGESSESEEESLMQLENLEVIAC